MDFPQKRKRFQISVIFDNDQYILQSTYSKKV